MHKIFDIILLKFKLPTFLNVGSLKQVRLYPKNYFVSFSSAAIFTHIQNIFIAASSSSIGG